MVTTTTAKAVVLLAVLWLWLAVRGGAAPSCSSVYNKMAPCVGYLTGKADDPSDRCCSGAKELKDMGRSNDDLQAICKCIRSAAADVVGFKRDRAVALPGKCGVHVDFPIGPDVDCSK
ncbi:Non-specific lipid-transfer protein 3 [Nymphaea thermarum]|nr:Non-specific lipid-transfer protein 3 [Nymphaea thermarum]